MRQGSSGFTLLELLVALVVAGAAVAIGYAGLVSVSEASARSRASSQPVFAAAAARSALSAWLSSATLMEGTHPQPFRGVHRTDGPTRSDQLTTAISNGGSLRPGPRRLRVWVDTDPLTPQRGPVVELAPIGDDRLASTDTLEIAPSATGLALRYLVLVDGRERWVDEWVSQSQLPRAVELRLLEFARARLGAVDDVPSLPPLLTIPIVVPITLDSW